MSGGGGGGGSIASASASAASFDLQGVVGQFLMQMQRMAAPNEGEAQMGAGVAGGPSSTKLTDLASAHRTFHPSQRDPQALATLAAAGMSSGVSDLASPNGGAGAKVIATGRVTCVD